MKNLRNILVVMTVFAVVLLGAGCTQQVAIAPSPTAQPVVQQTAPAVFEATVIDPLKEMGPKVQFEMADGGKMVFKLMPRYAPLTVSNFVKLVNSKFFDGLKFHRIMKTFMVQGGDGSQDASKPVAESIYGEFASNGFPQNSISHVKGVISMAKGGDPNSATSQFFIVTGEAKFLDGGYAAFGKLISGQKTLDKIANTPVTANPSGEMSEPTVDVVVKTVTIIN